MPTDVKRNPGMVDWVQLLFGSSSRFLSATNNTGAYEVVHRATSSEIAAITQQKTTIVMGHHFGAGDLYRNISGTVSMAIPCRMLMGQSESYYTIATSIQSDWITVWSMNDGNPDLELTLTPRYFAHPLQVRLNSIHRPEHCQDSWPSQAVALTG